VIVVDASAVVDFVLGRLDETRLEGRGRLHVPHLIDYEVVQALRRLRDAALAARALEIFRDIRMTRYPLAPYLERVWALRRNLSSYDASYVALAEGLGVPLLTTDARLARSAGHMARIEVLSG